MTIAVSDAEADRVTRTEFPPEASGGKISRDFAYIGQVLGLHIRKDPIVGPLLWITAIGLASIGTLFLMRSQVRVAEATNAMVAGNGALVSKALLGGLLFIGLYGFNEMLSVFLGMMLRIRIRTALTTRLLQRWFSSSHFYNPVPDNNLDHPEQRIQEDTFVFVQYATVLVPAVLKAIVSFSAYSLRLWRMSPSLSIKLTSNVAFEIPKALYLAAIVSAVATTIFAHLVGRMLTRTDVVRQRLEAGFRHDLGTAREFSEQIVLSGGIKAERSRAEHGYRLIRKNWTVYSSYLTIVNGVQIIVNMVGPLIPMFLAFPLVVSGKMKVGDLALLGAAFSAVHSALSTGSTRYEEFALLRSATMRIHYLDRLFGEQPKSGMQRTSNTDSLFRIDDLKLDGPAGNTLLRLPRYDIRMGDKLLVQGRSGAGKSTFFRLLAGIWPFGSGTVSAPSTSNGTMFVPQRPYLPDGTLAELLSYPDDSSAYSDEDYRAVLSKIRLERLTPDIDAHRAWSKILSPGEQQRICLARAILRKPDFLFLDEATSALDPQTEAEVFEMLTNTLHESAIVTIAHTDKLNRFHNRRLKIFDGVAETNAVK